MDGDDELLAQTLGGSAEAFGRFYRRHERVVLLYFLRRTGSAELAADLTGETFAAALESLRRYRPGLAPARAWLFGIAHNKLLMSIRAGAVEVKARRRLALEVTVLADDSLEAVESLADSDQVTGALADAIAELPAGQRAAIEGKVLEGHSYAELAARLRCSEAVVRQRVSRGLRAMRVAINEGGD